MLVPSAAEIVAVPILALLIGKAFGVVGGALAEAAVLSAPSAGLIGLILASRFHVAVEEVGSVVRLTAVGMSVTLAAWILLLHKSN